MKLTAFNILAICESLAKISEKEFDLNTACRIAGNHNRFDMLRHQKADDLSGVADDGVLGFASIRNPRRISKIDDPFFWHLPHDLSGYGQTADAGIENADRCR